MPGRQFNNGNYRYGFNGKENDNEAKGTGNSVDFGARIYDSRLGRWMSIDPLFKKYPYQSPYDFAINCPILFIDVDGQDIIASDKDKAIVMAALGKVTQGEVKITATAISEKNGGGWRINVEPKKGVDISDETKVVVKLAGKDAGTHNIKLNNSGIDQSTGVKGTKNTNIDFDPNDQSTIENKDGTVGVDKSKTFILLYHELLHSENFSDGVQGTDHLEGAEEGTGIYPPISEQNKNIDKTGKNTALSKDEYNVRTKENKLRDKVGVSERKVGTTEKTTYKGSEKKK